MKKIILTTALSVFVLAGTASASLFTNTVDVNVTLAEGPFAGIVYSSTETYYHQTPVDFEVPWDIVNSASLTISGYWIDGNNDSVAVEGTTVGTLTAGGTYDVNWSWSSWSWVTSNYIPSISTFDIASTFSTWSTGDDFAVTLASNGSWGDAILQINQSTFNLDYDNQTAPVPEPSTMLLFGTGILGLVGYSRKRSNKKA
ncbi:PEP-CTERM sorting domain-containing protein [Desulforhopalus sp. 52FAK]